MAGKNLSDKELKALQAAHTAFRADKDAKKIVTASKVKEYCKALDHHCSAELAEEIADLVYKALWKSVVRCDGNNRSTIMPVDL